MEKPSAAGPGTTDTRLHRRSLRRRVAAIGLVGYTLLVVAWALFSDRMPDTEGFTFWDLQEAGQLILWLSGLARQAAWQLACHLAIGLLTALTLGSAVPRSYRVRMGRWLGILLAAWVLSAVVRGFELGELPALTYLAWPWTGCLIGHWLGMTAVRGLRAVPWFILQLASLVLLVSASSGELLLAVLEKEPMPFQAATVTSAQKRRLVALIRSSREVPIDGQDHYLLRLGEQDVDLLVAWGLSLGTAQRKARVEFGQGKATALVCWGAIVPRLGQRFLNVRLDSVVQLDDGHLQVQIQRLVIGAVPVPRLVLAVIEPMIVAAIVNDPDTGSIIGSLQRLDIRPGNVDLIYGKGAFKAQVLPPLIARLGAHPDLVEATRAQVHYLIDLADELPDGDERFGAFMQAAFTLAAVRSRVSSPQLENRAAIYALGILLGHPKVEMLLGTVTDAKLRRTARRQIRAVPLRGRRDWTRHFWVSAVVAIVSSEALSDAIGLLKEELDAGGQGSGLSFADLMADRAGTLFGLAATGSEQAGRTVQQRLQAGFDLDAYFPQADDLPEGIDAEQLESQYDGVGGVRYRQIERQIEDRLESCPGLW